MPSRSSLHFKFPTFGHSGAAWQSVISWLTAWPQFLVYFTVDLGHQTFLATANVRHSSKLFIAQSLQGPDAVTSQPIHWCCFFGSGNPHNFNAYRVFSLGTLESSSLWNCSISLTNQGVRPMSHLQFFCAILSRKCATKSRDKVTSISVQHSVNRVAQNRAETSVLRLSASLPFK